LLPPFAAMVPSTALSFLLLGLVLLIQTGRPPKSEALRYGMLAATAAVALVASMDLVVIATGSAPSVDSLLWPGLVHPEDGMSPATAMCFLLAAASIALNVRWPGRMDFAFVTLATAGLLIAVIAVVGYAFDARTLYQVSAFTAMALHTAIAFVALCAAILLTRPGAGWVGILLGRESGSAEARRLFPIIVLLPFVVSLSALSAQQAGLFDLNFSFCLLAILTTVLLATALIQNAALENRAERRVMATMSDLSVAVADRDLLLRELYHRVKNNLQQINALIHMETSRLKDPAAKASFRATAGRIYALGTVHRLLISGPSPSQLNTATFLHDLCENIGASYDAGGQGIAIHIETDDIPISIDAAIPIGMLVNEIVTNALKHAFRGRSTGDIWASFRVAPDGGAELAIKDNGIGLPQASLELSSANGSGSRIIQSFVKQVRGSMTIKVETGTTVTIQLPPGFEKGAKYG
jgi:two-component sensor histidine kinase